MSASNGRCNGSTGGGSRSVRRRFTREKSLFKEEIEVVEAADSGCETNEEELLAVRDRRRRGGARAPNSHSGLHSESSSTPIPPIFRHVRPTRSAHSKTFTRRTAPKSSKASGSTNRSMRTAGCTLKSIDGGWWVAIMRRENVRRSE
jgi:hypothetical protein